MTPAEAREALDVVARARRQVADEVGLPRLYWWAMAVAWVLAGVLQEFGPQVAVSILGLLFGTGHAAFASRYLDGRRRRARLRVSASVAGRRTPAVVIGMLLGLVAVTVVAGNLLYADGAGHPSIWASILVGAVIGLGGPEILATLRRWTRA